MAEPERQRQRGKGREAKEVRQRQKGKARVAKPDRERQRGIMLRAYTL